VLRSRSRWVFGVIAFALAIALSIIVQTMWLVVVAGVTGLSLAAGAFWRALDSPTSTQPYVEPSRDPPTRRLPGPGEDPGIGPVA
jgi:hypothetical protein